jgi:hypothetical protein
MPQNRYGHNEVNIGFDAEHCRCLKYVRQLKKGTIAVYFEKEIKIPWMKGISDNPAQFPWRRRTSNYQR